MASAPKAQQNGWLTRIRAWLGAERPDLPSLSEGQFSTIISIASDAIITTGEDLRILNFNHGAEEIFGYRAAEMVGRHINLLIPGRLHAAHNEHVRTFARSGVSARRMGQRREILGVRKHGEEFPAEASISQMREGGRTLFTVVLRDISDRRRRELTNTLLARAGELLAGSLDTETTLASVARLIVPGAADGCVVYVYDAQQKLVRAALAHHDEVIEQQLSDLLQHEAVTNPTHPVWQVIEQRAPLVIHELRPEVLQTMAENEPHARIIEHIGARSAIIVPMIARGSVCGAIAFFGTGRRRAFDADDLALAEELGRRSALALDNARLYREARAAVEARDDMLAVVSHDLGNPLSAIRIGTTMLLSTLPDSEKESGGWKHLVGIRNSAEQMERLINDLLEVKRMEAGQFSVERDRVSVAPLIGEARELLANIAAARNVRLTVHAPDGVPPIHADRERMLQAFSNLVGNAVKFTEPGGTVRIEAEARHHEVVLSVVDDGCGISAEDLPHVFDRYWQARDRRRGSQGIGLGLVIVKGIVEAHGGRLWADSQPGVGSRFSFSVPLWSEAAAARAE